MEERIKKLEEEKMKFEKEKKEREEKEEKERKEKEEKERAEEQKRKEEQQKKLFLLKQNLEIKKNTKNENMNHPRSATTCVTPRSRGISTNLNPFIKNNSPSLPNNQNNQINKINQINNQINNKNNIISNNNISPLSSNLPHPLPRPRKTIQKSVPQKEGNFNFFN